MAQEHRRSPHELEREGRSAPGPAPLQSCPVPARRRNGGASFALLYVIFVIGISALLACIGWVAANDVLALNKPEKTATITIREEGQLRRRGLHAGGKRPDRVPEPLQALCRLHWRRDKIVAGTFTLNTDMDYRA